MGKILLVEPSRILRQAISLFLFPENEVRVEERITDPKAESLEGYDLLIFDGPELRERGWWSAELEEAVKSSGVPVLWLEDENGLQSVARQEKRTVLKKPVLRESLRAAAASFLSAAGKSGAGESPRTSPQQQAFRFIDLVEEAEEEPSSTQPNRPAKKSE